MIVLLRKEQHKLHPILFPKTVFFWQTLPLISMALAVSKWWRSRAYDLNRFELRDTGVGRQVVTSLVTIRMLHCGRLTVRWFADRSWL